jgi:hypothetical protein
MAIAVATLAFLLVRLPAVCGQSLVPVIPSQALNGLVYPTNSQQFFEAGKQQLDTEINRLQERQQTPAESVLKIDGSLFNREALEELRTIPTELQPEDN